MRRITILNPKGGSGKTTLATNLAAYYASRGFPTALMDFDPQGSSMRWLKVRPPTLAPIHGVAAYQNVPGRTRSFQLRVPPGTTRVVVRFARGDRAPALRGVHQGGGRHRGAGAALADRHPRLRPLHRAPADDREDQAPGGAHRRGGEPRAAEHPRVPLTDALPRDAGHPDHGDVQGVAELHPLLRAGPGAARDACRTLVAGDTREMAAILAQRCGVRVRCYILDEETHASAPFAAFSRGLRWLHKV